MFVSVLGDSISTFTGYSQADYPVFYTPEECTELGLSGVEDTWWMKLIQMQGWNFLKNCSFSGRKVIESGLGCVSAEQQANLLRSNLAAPDIILIYLGLNDFGSGIPVHRAAYMNGNYDFHRSYCEMLYRLRNMYPEALIFCGTLMRAIVKNRLDWVFPEAFGSWPLNQYNQAIRQAVGQEQCTLIDLAATGIRYETLDGAHPTKDGHADLCRAWKLCLDAIVSKHS